MNPDFTWMLTKLSVIIISQHIPISNHYGVQVRLIQWCMSIISQKTVRTLTLLVGEGKHVTLSP